MFRSIYSTKWSLSLTMRIRANKRQLLVCVATNLLSTLARCLVITLGVQRDMVDFA